MSIDDCSLNSGSDLMGSYIDHNCTTNVFYIPLFTLLLRNSAADTVSTTASH
eukprot:gene2107-12082_t